MASPAPVPSGATHGRLFGPPSPPASSVGSSTASPPRKKRRSRRPPPLLGLVCDDCDDGFYPAGVAEPHPSANRAFALARKADFEYFFVPRVPEDSFGWFPLDARDGRVLIYSDYYPTSPSAVAYYAVCDPLFKRYVMLPPIPDDLTVNQGSRVGSGLCLAPPSQEEDEVVDTSFRVIYVAAYKTKLVVFVFSSVTRQWGIGTSSNWTSLLGTQEPPTYFYGLEHFDYVDGCLYWTELLPDKILVLDALKMELSVIHYAHSVEYGFRACIAVDREGDPGMLTVGEYLGKQEFRLSRIAKKSDHESPNERLSENIIELPSIHNEYFPLGAAEGFIFLRGIPEDDEDDEDEEAPYWEPLDYYSLNVKTAEFEMVCTRDKDEDNRVYPYFRFAPAKPCV